MEPISSGERFVARVRAKPTEFFDSLFAREEDLALRFTAANFLIANTQTPGKYQFEASGRIEEASEASFAVELDKNYLQKRWVPHYSPIDRERCPTAPTGWLSWNTYFDTATAEDNLAEARIGKEFLQPFGCEIWNIESWQGNSDRLPVSGFYNLGLEVNEKQFPKGMKQLADDIRALGFKPGLWTAPFGTGSKEFYEAQRLVSHDENGALTHVERRLYDRPKRRSDRLIRHIHDASRTNGDEFFKIDGMSGSGSGYCAHFERRKSAPPLKIRHGGFFERCVKAFEKELAIVSSSLAMSLTGSRRCADGAPARILFYPNQPVKANLGSRRCTLNQVCQQYRLLLIRHLLVNEALTSKKVTTTVVALPTS